MHPKSPSPPSSLKAVKILLTKAIDRVSPVAQLVKNPPVILETWVRFLGLGRSPGEGKGYPLQYPGLENSMDFIVHVVIKSRI